MIGQDDLLLQPRAGGLLRGLVDPPSAAGLASPQPFAGFDARSWNIPVVNKLLGVFDFMIGAGSGFVLPGSGEALVTAVPERSAAAARPGTAAAGRVGAPGAPHGAPLAGRRGTRGAATGAPARRPPGAQRRAH